MPKWNFRGRKDADATGELVAIERRGPAIFAKIATKELGSRETVHFRPRITRVGEGACMLYPGDAGYEANDPQATGARHRLLASKEGWRYERD